VGDSELEPEEASYRWIRRLDGRRHLRLADTEFFRCDRGTEHPVNDLEPLIIAEAHHGRDRLLRDAVRENDVIVRISQHRARRGQSGAVLADRVAAPAGEGTDCRAQILHHHGLERDAVLTREVGEVELRRRALLNAYRGAVELRCARHLRRFPQQEALAVVEIDRAEMEVPLQRSTARYGRSIDEQIDLT